jgi:hypothetical protein
VKGGGKKSPARKSRKREDSDDLIKEIAPLQTPGRPGKKRKLRKILNPEKVPKIFSFIFSPPCLRRGL